MILVISAWYNEPGINFKVSHKVDNYIRESIKEHIMQPLGLIEANPHIYLSINVTTTTEQDKLEVKFGRFTKRSEFMRVGFWFPYRQIVGSEYPLKAYVENYLAATKIMFAKWNVTEEQISRLNEDVLTKVLYNKEYEYVDLNE